MRLSASLVLYNNRAEQFGEAIRCFLEGSEGSLVVVDNSPTQLQHPLLGHPRVRYEFSGENLGFGRAHNRALSIIGNSSDVHLYMNPDVSFGPEVLPTLLAYFGCHETVGAAMPRIEYLDGSLQRLCKLLPTPVDLIFRRFVPIPSVQAAINKRYELHALPQDEPIAVPSLSGCFLLARTGILHDLGGFDERFFMYMEDVDLVRRIGGAWSTMYVPSVSIFHGYEKASYKNKVLRRAHARSAFAYFSKWGWVFDRERAQRNRQMISRVELKSVERD